jgi:hypothetical protein
MLHSSLLKKYHVKIDNKMKPFGETDTKRRVIRVNAKKSKSTGQRGELLDSIVHETKHALHPRKSEESVQKMTARATARMNRKTKSKYYQLLKRNVRRKQDHQRKNREGR